MIGAVLTAVFFGITPVCASRAIKLIGFVRENVLRLLFAVVALGIWAFAFGQGLRGESLLFASAGAIGFGIGGMSLLIALPRLGAPLASLAQDRLDGAVGRGEARTAASSPAGRCGGLRSTRCSARFSA